MNTRKIVVWFSIVLANFNTFATDPLALPSVTWAITISNWSSAPLTVGTLDDTPRHDTSGSIYQSVVCDPAMTMTRVANCQHITGSITIEPGQRKSFGYQTKPNFGIILNFTTSNVSEWANLLKVNHKNKTTSIKYSYGQNIAYTDYGQYSYIQDTFNWNDPPKAIDYFSGRIAKTAIGTLP